jgi:hypothetical protein
MTLNLQSIRRHPKPPGRKKAACRIAARLKKRDRRVGTNAATAAGVVSLLRLSENSPTAERDCTEKML